MTLSSPVLTGEVAKRSEVGGGVCEHAPLSPSALGFASRTSPATAGEERSDISLTTPACNEVTLAQITCYRVKP